MHCLTFFFFFRKVSSRIPQIILFSMHHRSRYSDSNRHDADNEGSLTNNGFRETDGHNWKDQHLYDDLEKCSHCCKITATPVLRKILIWSIMTCTWNRRYSRDVISGIREQRPITAEHNWTNYPMKDIYVVVNSGI